MHADAIRKVWSSYGREGKTLQEIVKVKALKIEMYQKELESDEYGSFHGNVYCQMQDAFIMFIVKFSFNFKCRI